MRFRNDIAYPKNYEKLVNLSEGKIGKSFKPTKYDVKLLDKINYHVDKTIVLYLYKKQILELMQDAYKMGYDTAKDENKYF
jgi:hypothetical protein